MLLSLMASAWSATVPQEIPRPGQIESPLPGGIDAVVRFFFNVPQAVQIGGLLLGAVVFVAAVVLFWQNREAVGKWLGTWKREVYVAAAGLAVGAVVIIVASGFWGWHYVEHDNAFCTGCHVMRPAYVRFTESEHDELECHRCHQQPISASLRQLYLWVADRPQEIGPHAPVPNSVCVTCHIRENPRHDWQAIESMQGHKVHLESDSSALADIQCVTCHGRELHRFVPTSATCGQSGCHSPQQTHIVLGTMASSQTSFHCLTCHRFTAPVADSIEVPGISAAQLAMLPTLRDCADCHAMREIIDSVMPVGEPHGGECGWCHNPHTQTQVSDAIQTCTKSGCHTDIQDLTPFHRGLHLGVSPDCTQCHKPHSWKVNGTECRSCHTNLSVRDPADRRSGWEGKGIAG